MRSKVRLLGFVALVGLLSTLTVAGSASDGATKTPSSGPAPTGWHPVPSPRLSSSAPQPLAATVAAKARAIPPLPPGTFGVNSTGTAGGGRFRDALGDAEAWFAADGLGVKGFGTRAGGSFKDADGSGVASLGIGDYGIQARGDYAGGYFASTDDTGFATIGRAQIGIEGSGNSWGAEIWDKDSSGHAYVAYGDRGIEASGDEMGGYFHDGDESGWARLGYGDIGIEAKGTDIGGHFADTNGSAEVYAGMGNTGIEASGNTRGGYFEDRNDGSWADVGYSTYKIFGTGSVNFVQNHPTDPGSVIVYTAPEGDEVATYTRGTARLSGGEAVVPLGETFAWVTNPDLGLTAYVTSVGSWCDLYVAEKGTDTLTVRSRDGADCTFDYIVYGLRIGFEELTIVQEKTQEAFIPSMRVHRERAAERPEYARSTALARFTAQRRALGIEERLDTSRSQALKAAIHEFDPKVDRIAPPTRDPRSPDHGTATLPGAASPLTTGPDSAASGALPLDAAAGAVAVPHLLPEDRDLVARSFSSPREQLATRVAVSGAVEPGDLLVTLPTPGHAMRMDAPLPGTVVGKALEPLAAGQALLRVLVMLR